MSKVFYNEYDHINGKQLRYNNGKWVEVEPSQVNKDDKLLSRFQGESIEDILEALFMLLISKGAIANMEEFEETFKALKLAEKLSEK